MNNEPFSPIEAKAATLFYQGSHTQLDYAGYCQVIQQASDLYLQLLRDYLERIPNQAIATHTIAVGQLMLEIQQML